MVPLAHSALVAGHHVLSGTSGPTVEASVHAGLPTLDVAPDKQVAAPYFRLGEAIMNEGTATEDLVREVFGRFGEISELMLDGLVRAAEEWGADAVVYPPAFPAGLVAARVAGIRAVMHGIGFRRPTLLPALENLESTDGGPRTADSEKEPDVEINVSPSSVEPEPVPGALPMRYGSYNGGAELPWWSLTSTDKPRVAVTLGSMSSTVREGELLTRIIRGAENLGVEIVLTSASMDLPALPKPLPDYVRVVDWLPLNMLLATCQAVVHHGGSGSTFTALRAGVPQLVVPHGGDRLDNATAVERRGCGRALSLSETTSADVADKLREVFEDPGYRAASTEVAEEMASMPGPESVISRLDSEILV
ncbi:glycosyltransferase [Actinopolyspora biskrensis]|uniref:Glycosyltransferase n=1 Tax=Actinopolyspora biskrensis TaxID=1470178 RepID=A0A852Z430_9ACTN|nr:nucleotide disphospho-sugar-binding domain-containing protein [Actinopolyspora biskrensis]NYH80920.1 glycosyltransferase [Actinopolyspora biskrensis]